MKTFVVNPRGEPVAVVDMELAEDGTVTETEDAAATAELNSVERKREAAKAAIDLNTNRIRDRDGLAYAGERFAMSDTAQLKWTGMAAMLDSLPFPLSVSTIDDRPFILADREAARRFLGAAMMYEFAPDSPVATGRALRARVEQARTAEEIEAIVDDRE